jgi:hypothetical protein
MYILNFSSTTAAAAVPAATISMLRKHARRLALAAWRHRAPLTHLSLSAAIEHACVMPRHLYGLLPLISAWARLRTLALRLAWKRRITFDAFSTGAGSGRDRTNVRAGDIADMPRSGGFSI